GGVALWEYDLAFDAAMRERPEARTLCFYDQRHYPADAIQEMRALHRHELSAPAVYDDGLLRITRTGRCRARLAGEIDHSNRPLIATLLEATLDEALRGHDTPDEIELNLASLRFLDVAGAVALVHAAESFPSSHRLVLTGVRPRVQRVLDRCGAPFAAQLAVQPHPRWAGGNPDAAAEMRRR
ncbi:MAG TPA: STAS domain-containing protein, partial [Pseudonocardia sp.]|nr:STAS domain-containing protein [Pseudonocardia sp.]